MEKGKKERISGQAFLVGNRNSEVKKKPDGYFCSDLILLRVYEITELEAQKSSITKRKRVPLISRNNPFLLHPDS